MRSWMPLLMLAVLLAACSSPQPAAGPKAAAFQMLERQGDAKAGPAFHRFKVGEFTITVLHDGGWDYPPGFLLGGLAGEAEMQKRYGLEGENPTIWSPYTVLFVDTGTNKVLLDTGAGKKPFAPTAGKMFESMKMAGITPADVDTVVITHAHPDHIAGLVDESGNLIFSNAKYYVGKAEYDFWGTEGFKEKLGDFGWLVDIALANLNAIKDKATMVDAETEIVPGMKAVPLSGHTPGHFMVEMATAGTNLWYVSDLFVMDLYVEHPDKRPGVIPGERKEILIEDTKKILARAAAEDPMIVAMHLPPFPSLGKIVKEGDGYKWEPVK